MENNKEKNFISAIVYVRNDEAHICEFLDTLNKSLSADFEKYEVICVDDFSTDLSKKKIEEFASKIDKCVISIISMSYYQGLEPSMNAGIDLAIGDFVFEFDTMNLDYEKSLIKDVYDHSLKGFDIVSASPNKKIKWSSKMFYNVFNRFSHIPNKIYTENFRIISRRGINRIKSMSISIPYRKAIYASCGLRFDRVSYEPTNQHNKVADDEFRWNVALNALILFTNIGYRIAITLSFLMMAATLALGGYAIFIFLNSAPIGGWTTTMLVMSFSFFGLFAVLAIIIKFLSILIELVFNKQKYIIKDINKLSK